ncbi:MAG TPA: hypothetical protein VE911_11550 [Candidatus Nitrosopolaris sp.]|nr:hypothetical protein [Candidatus Nitrosopolaris sp.]
MPSVQTLADQAKLSKGDDLTQGVIANMLGISPWFRRFPFRTISTLSARGLRTGTLPSVTWRALNSNYTSDVGTIDMFQESAYALGGLIQVDRLLEEDGNLIERPRTVQTRLKSEAMIRTFGNCLVNGDRANATTYGGNAFDGIKVRIGLLGTEQTVDGASLDISTAANRAGANGAQMAFLMRKAYQRVARVCGKVDIILLNEDAKLNIEDILMQQNYLRTTTDSFDRTITTFQNAELVDPGYGPDVTGGGGGTRILTNTHDGDAINTSLYFLALGEDYLQGLQRQPLKVTDLGLDPTNGNNYLTHFEAVWGLWGGNSFWGCRLKGIKVI